MSYPPQTNYALASLPREGDMLADKYLIEHVLGEGGMCVVFAARHVQLEQRVAIKVLRPEMATQPEVLERFLREGKAASRIKSDHVTRVFDVGSVAGVGPYIVMECLYGSDLDALLLANGPLPVEAAVDYVLQAGEAVAEAHALGIVHRDLKPANVFLTRRADGSPFIKVLDFGISKSAGPSRDLGLTSALAVMGSPRYMSPEQMRATRDVDARTDIWALGVILYELLAGEPPFHGETVTEICASILQDAPRSLRSFRDDVSPSLASAVNRALAKNPNDRFANVAELALAISESSTSAGKISTNRIVGIQHAGMVSATPNGGILVRTGAGAAWGTTHPSWEDVATKPPPPMPHVRQTRHHTQRARRRGWTGALGIAAAIVFVAGSGAAAATWYLQRPTEHVLAARPAPPTAVREVLATAIPSAAPPAPAELGDALPVDGDARPGAPVNSASMRDASAAAITTALATPRGKAETGGAKAAPAAAPMGTGGAVAPPPSDDSLFDERK